MEFGFIPLDYLYAENIELKVPDVFYSNSADTTFRLQHGNENKILRLQKKRKKVLATPW